MRAGGWWGVAILVLTGLVAGGGGDELQEGTGAAGGCPAVCQCKWRDGKEAALCVRAGLRALPALPPGTQLLDFAGNKLAGGVLPPRALAGRGLLHLQRLVLAECGLRELRPGALAGLRNLVALDLANNLLSAVPTRALSAAPELRDLSLAGNPLLRLADDALQGLAHLERLDVSGCRLREVAPRALSGAAGSLRLLRLADNGLRELPAAAVGALRALAALELAGNPWECECRLRPLLVLLRRRNLPPGAPDCATPARLAARPWSALHADDFACAPTALATESSVRAREGASTSLSCTIEGDPTPDVRWSRAGRPLNDESPRVSVRTEGGVSRVVLSAVKARDGGVYMCTAENRAGRTEVTVALTIVRGDAPAERDAGRRAAAAAATIAGGALACGAVYALCRRLRGHKRGPRQSRAPELTQGREERYNKVPEDKSGEPGGSPLRVRGDYVHVPLYDPDSPPGAPPARTRSPPQPDLHIPRRDRDLYSCGEVFSPAPPHPGLGGDLDTKFPDLVEMSSLSGSLYPPAMLPRPPSSTPLLELGGLDEQLEHFLDEYRSLRAQLAAVRGSRHSLQRALARPRVAVTRASSALPDAPSALCLSSPPASPQHWMSSLLRH